MKLSLYMTATCAVSLALTSAAAPGVSAELVLGAAAPLMVALTTMTMIERTHRRDPVEVTPLMIKAFGAKMVLFGGYVVAVIAYLPISPTPFIVSFAVSFIALHVTEAFRLRSLFAEVMS